jgi:hypothetical protein
MCRNPNRRNVSRTLTAAEQCSEQTNEQCIGWTQKQKDVLLITSTHRYSSLLLMLPLIATTHRKYSSIHRYYSSLLLIAPHGYYSSLLPPRYYSSLLLIATTPRYYSSLLLIATTPCCYSSLLLIATTYRYYSLILFIATTHRYSSLLPPRYFVLAITHRYYSSLLLALIAAKLLIANSTHRSWGKERCGDRAAVMDAVAEREGAVGGGRGSERVRGRERVKERERDTGWIKDRHIRTDENGPTNEHDELYKSNAITLIVHEHTQHNVHPYAHTTYRQVSLTHTLYIFTHCTSLRRDRAPSKYARKQPDPLVGNRLIHPTR